MTDEMIPMTEEVAEAGRTLTERVSVTGGELIETVQSLLREAAVRKITIQDKDGRNLLEIPLYAGIAGALILGSATVLALIAAWFAQVSILIERDKAHDGGPTAVGEVVERAAGSASSAAASASAAASQVVGGVTAFFGGAARGAGDAARHMADALEARLGRAVDTSDAAAGQAAESAEAAAEKIGEAADAAAEKAGEVANSAAAAVEDAAEALGTKAHEAADALADMAPERQCAAITKAGTRCKRPAMDGSDFCSMHQVA